MTVIVRSVVPLDARSITTFNSSSVYDCSGIFVLRMIDDSPQLGTRYDVTEV